MNDVLDLLESILASRQVDAASMQVFDAIALSARLDKQVKSLAEYILKSMPLSLSVDASATATTVKTINNQTYCTISVNASDQTTITVTFVDRVLWQARAYAVNGSTVTNYDVTIAGNVLTVHNCKSTEPIQIQLI